VLADHAEAVRQVVDKHLPALLKLARRSAA
jgi:hypothetical protein